MLVYPPILRGGEESWDLTLAKQEEGSHSGAKHNTRLMITLRGEELGDCTIHIRVLLCMPAQSWIYHRSRTTLMQGAYRGIGNLEKKKVSSFLTNEVDVIIS